jgi:hypothetical protein
MLVATIGNAIAATSTVNAVRYFAMFLMPMGSISACKFPKRTRDISKQTSF